MNDLQAYPTKELIDELRNRFDHCVFIGAKPGKTPGMQVRKWNWKGDDHFCMGLASEMIQTIHEKIKNNRVDLDKLNEE